MQNISAINPNAEGFATTVYSVILGVPATVEENDIPLVSIVVEEEVSETAFALSTDQLVTMKLTLAVYSPTSWPDNDTNRLHEDIRRGLMMGSADLDGLALSVKPLNSKTINQSEGVDHKKAEISFQIKFIEIYN